MDDDDCPFTDDDAEDCITMTDEEADREIRAMGIDPDAAFEQLLSRVPELRERLMGGEPVLVFAIMPAADYEFGEVFAIMPIPEDDDA